MAEMLSQKRRKSSLVFPNEPKTDRGAFLRFIEKSGAAAVMEEVLEALQAVSDRPDDPIHWIRNYLRQKAPRRTAELNAIIESLKSDIIDLETELHNSKVFTEMQEETKVMRTNLWYPQKLFHHYPLDQTYLENGGDEIWQVKPDPHFKPATGEVLIPPTLESTQEEDAIMQELMTPPRGASNQTLFTSSTRSQRGSLMDDLLEGQGDFVERVSSSPLCKSTETSPQISQENLLNEQLFKDAEQIGMDGSDEFQPLTPISVPEEPLPLPKIEDEDFLARRIPPNFWKHSFDVSTFGDEQPEIQGLGEDDSVPASPLLHGADYKMPDISENSWLPGRDPAYHVRRNLYYERLDKSDMPNSVPEEWLGRFRGSLGGERHFHPPQLTKKQKAGLKILNQQHKHYEKSVAPIIHASESEVPIAEYEWTEKKHGGTRLRRFSKKKVEVLEPENE